VHVDAIGNQGRGRRRTHPARHDLPDRVVDQADRRRGDDILVEECRLRLDEPVDRLLPELANRTVLKRLDGPLDDTVPAKRPITVRDLLAFRAGYGVVMGAARTRTRSRER